MLTEIECAQCHKKFYRSKVRKSTKNYFCCQECRNQFQIEGKSDEFSPFRYFMHKIEQKSKKYNEISDIDLQFLKFLWRRQRGICHYSGLKMRLPKTCNETINSPQRASLDRINSSRGYFQDNVEFVCQFVNLGKNTFSKKDIDSLFKKIKMNAKRKSRRK